MVLPNRNITLFLIYGSPFLMAVLSLFIGAYDLPSGSVIDLIIKKIMARQISSVEQSILFDIRIPRIILVLLVGSALSLSSACFQASFRNPLVSEYILGVSAGAAFGASLSIAYLGHAFPVQPLAFAGGVSAVCITFFIAQIKRRTTVISLVLAGIITTALFTAGNYIIRYFSTPERIHVLIVWLMGSFSSASWKDVYQSGPFILSGSLILFLLRWRLNLLSMGDEEARALGVEAEKLKIIFIGISTIITSAAISVVGIIGWIGLMVPHIARMLVGSDHRIVLPVSALLGATLLLISDTIVRMRGGIELPVGVLTTLFGVPFFAYLVKKTKGGGWE